MMKAAKFGVALLLSVSTGAFAGPDATTQYLMSDPVSMLDMGLLRMNLSLRELKLGNASYDWATNRIIVRNNLFSFIDGSSEGAEEYCAAWVLSVRADAGINTDTGLTWSGNSAYADFFSHYGFKGNLEPSTLGSDLDKLITLECTAFPKDLTLKVLAALLGKTYAVEKIVPAKE